MQVTFYGAAGGVTGSKHLVDTGQARILLDCGTFQGLSDVRERNRSFSFEPKSIDNVILSHAHIDHCGMLPLLVKKGFNGKIFSTPTTRDVAQHMLEDSAGIEEQDAIYRQKHHIGAAREREPLFTRDDIPMVMEKFVEVDYVRVKQGWTQVMPGVKVKLYDAGHILGSAVTVLELDGPDGTKRLAYSGDVGAPGTPILFDPQVPREEVGTVILESTYGSRTHKSLDDAVVRLGETINRVVKKRGKIIMPAFSLGRTQALVYILHKLTDAGVISRVPIFVDSPLATDITEFFRRHRDDYDKETAEDFGKGHAALDFSNLTYTNSVEESKRLNVLAGPFIIISASGMMTAGRVVHHLRQTISDDRNAVFITGYQAQGTLGRRLLEGADRVELYGDWFNVRAEMIVFNEFSAHGDGGQMADYVGSFRGVKQVALVHGEVREALALRERLAGDYPQWEIHRPDEGDVITIK